jgi:hypothetical protein
MREVIARRFFSDSIDFGSFLKMNEIRGKISPSSQIISAAWGLTGKAINENKGLTDLPKFIPRPALFVCCIPKWIMYNSESRTRLAIC